MEWKDPKKELPKKMDHILMAVRIRHPITPKTTFEYETLYYFEDAFRKIGQAKQRYYTEYSILWWAKIPDLPKL